MKNVEEADLDLYRKVVKSIKNLGGGAQPVEKEEMELEHMIVN